MVHAHQYRAAIDRYLTYPQEQMGPTRNVELGTAYLCEMQYDLAELYFRRSIEIYDLEQSKEIGKSDSAFIWLSVALLLQDKLDDVIKLLSSVTVDIRSGVIARSDSAGGASAALLLQYAGQIAGNTEALKTASRHIKWMLRRRRPKSWPLPEVALMDGSMDESSMLRHGFGTSDVSAILLVSTEDLHVRKMAASAFFYAQRRRRLDGDTTVANKYLALVAEMMNPILSPEWYLARRSMLSERVSS